MHANPAMQRRARANCSNIQIDIKLDVRSRNITDCLKNQMNTRVSIRNYINSKTYHYPIWNIYSNLKITKYPFMKNTKHVLNCVLTG